MLSAPSFVAKADSSPGTRSRSSAAKRLTGSSLSPRSNRQTNISFLGALRDADEDVPPVPKLDLADIEIHQLNRLKDLEV